MHAPPAPLAFRFVALIALGAALLGGLLVPAALAQDTSRVVEASGVTLTLPGAWTADPVASEDQGVRRVTLAEQAEDSPLRGARLVVEVLPGLNRLQQERWLRGQLLRGLDASMDLEPADLSLLGGSVGTAVSFRDGRRAGYALYTRGGPFYSVRIEAHTALWADAEAEQALLDLARSVRVAD